MNYIAFDAHKRYTLASVERAKGGILREVRVGHERGAIRQFLLTCDAGFPVAVETMGSWYWIVDEIEEAGMVPRLVHASASGGKLMMGSINKTDKLDARGLNLLQRNGTLPTVWIPSAQLRDKRELPRMRMVLSRERTRLKNRIHATLAKYALDIHGISDIFGKAGRELIKQRMEELSPHTRYATELVLEQLEVVEGQISLFEQRIKEVFSKTGELQLVRDLT